MAGGSCGSRLHTILIRARFDADELAESFRQSFGGSYEGLPPPAGIDAVKPGATASDWRWP